MRKLVIAFAAAAVAVPAFAAPTATAPSGQPEQPKKEKKICKRVQESGSRLATSVCKTAAEWEKDPTTGDLTPLGVPFWNRMSNSTFLRSCNQGVGRLGAPPSP